jgi:hypothetical protein
MADIGASVLARLKNKAAESGRSYQLCMQLFCQEEFLRRVEKSRYADNLVLKGGLFLYTLLIENNKSGRETHARISLPSYWDELHPGFMAIDTKWSRVDDIFALHGLSDYIL